MCGLLAVIPKQQNPIDRDLFNDCLNLLKHRGPDNTAVHLNSYIAMGHTRLSIIDRTFKANQPFTDRFFGNFLIFNGEIYNFQEIKKKLSKNGYVFHTGSDTEVLYVALSTIGTSIIPELNGMFSFIFWDENKKSLIVARDRFGIKPLFYYESETELIFASEIKAIISYLDKTNLNSVAINKKSLNEYLIFQNIISEQTFFDKIIKFQAGTFRKISFVNDKFCSSQQMFWNWRRDAQNGDCLPDYEVQLETHIEAAVQSQLIGDVNLGAFLSAGLDSSLISYYASKNLEALESFSVGFAYPEEFEIENFSDEVHEAREIADFLKIKNYSTIISEQDLFSSLSVINRVLEEPRMGQSYPNYFASRLASEHAIVVLSGAGGDELFGGYPWRYEIINHCDSWNDLLSRHFDSAHKLLAPDEVRNLLKINLEYGDIERPRMLHREFFSKFIDVPYSSSDALQAVMSYDAQIFLEGLLGIEDKIGMSFSIETRFPFLDNNLVDFVLKNRKFGANFLDNSKGGENSKRDLRRLAKRHLPLKVADRRKQGFTGPDAFWFRSEFSDKVFSNIFRPDRAIWDYVDYDRSMSYLKLHQKGARNLRHLIWSLLCLSEFFEKVGK